MSKFSPMTKHNPCPLCGDTSGKCRSVNELVLCMTFADSKKGETVNGYKCVGEVNAAKQYFGSKWLLDNTAQWTEEKRREWEQQREIRQQQQAKEEEFKKGRSLSAEERDRDYRATLNQLYLHPDDKADLLRRGFTEQEIIASRFKSVSKGQVYLTNKINPMLPGASGGDGKRIFSSVDGYLCPVIDINGLICGMQIRARNAEKGNRYSWLNTKHQTLHLFPDGNKELPLAIYRSEEKSTGVILVEGTGAKPFLTANRLNKNVIGAAGGMFAASPTLLKQSLEVLAEDKKVKISPDAGDVLNPAVVKRWKIVADLIIEFGYNPVFLWWNQVIKDDRDIDELSDYSQIKNITPEQFFDIAKEAQKEAKRAEKEAERAEKEREERLKEEAENTLYAELTSIIEKPWLELNTPILELDEYIEPGAIYIVVAAKGTGKTNAIKPVVERFNSVYAWFSRRALGNEECHRIGIDWDKNVGFNSRNRVGFCADSAHKYNPEKIGKNGMLLIDEADQVFDHIFGDTCNKDGKRPMIQAHLEAHLDSVIAGNGVAIFMSADNSQKEIDYIKELAPIGTPIRLIVNNYKPEKGNLYFDESDTPDGQIETVLNRLEDGIPCFVIDDMKNGVKGCKSIAEYIRTVHPEWATKIREINSDTSGDPEIISFLENINEASKEVLLICCSPSVISGISIENGRFNEGVFGFFNGVLTVSQASQALSRVRGANYTYVWAAKKGLVWAANQSTHPREISEFYQRNYAANSKHIQSFKPEYEPISGEWSSPHWRLYCKNAAYRNLCMSKLRERLKAHLIDEGFNIYYSASAESDMVKNGLKSSWSRIELAEAVAVATAEIYSDAELEELEFRNEALSPEEKVRFEKTMLFKSFGEDLIQATTFTHPESKKTLKGYAAMYLKNERGEYQQQLNNFYLLTSGVEEAISQDIARENRQLKHGFGRFPGDFRWRSRQFKAREFLGLDQFLVDPQKWTTPNDYRKLAGKARQHAKLVKDALGVNVERMKYDSQIFVELMEQLGLKFDAEWVENGTTADGKRRRYKRRRITAESWQHAQMYVDYRQSLKAEAEAKQEAYEASKAPTEAPEVKVQPVQELSSANSAFIESQENVMDRPPLNLYTESFLGGGRSIAESQAVIEVEPISEIENLAEKLAGASDFAAVKNLVEQFGADRCDNATAFVSWQHKRRVLDLLKAVAMEPQQGFKPERFLGKQVFINATKSAVIVTNKFIGRIKAFIDGRFELMSGQLISFADVDQGYYVLE